MDMSDVTVRHTLAPLNIEVVHRIESSSAVVSLFREVRICVIVLVAGWVATSDCHGFSLIIEYYYPTPATSRVRQDLKFVRENEVLFCSCVLDRGQRTIYY